MSENEVTLRIAAAGQGILLQYMFPGDKLSKSLKSTHYSYMRDSRSTEYCEERDNGVYIGPLGDSGGTKVELMPAMEGEGGRHWRIEFQWDLRYNDLSELLSWSLILFSGHGTVMDVVEKIDYETWFAPITHIRPARLSRPSNNYISISGIQGNVLYR